MKIFINFVKKYKFTFILFGLFLFFLLISLPFGVLNKNNDTVKKSEVAEAYKIYGIDKNQDEISGIKVGAPVLYTDDYIVMVIYKDGSKEEYPMSFMAYNFLSSEILNKLDLEKIKLDIVSKDKFSEFKANNKAKIHSSDLSSRFTEAYGSKMSKNIKSFGKFLAVSAPILLIGLLVLLMAKQMGFLGKDYDVLQPSDIDGCMDDLIGMEDIKKEVLQLKDMYEQREKYHSHDLHKSFNIMFTGPAGTGKTKLAGYLSKELNMPIIIGSAASLETGFVAGGSHRLKAIYAKALKYKKCIIFLDEAEILLRKRGQSRISKYDDDTTNAFLALLDGVSTKKDTDIVWVVATNFDDVNTEMDEAAMRRFHIKINFRLPNKEERSNILNFFLSKKQKIDVDEDLNLEHIAEVTGRLSPAILKNITDAASIIAINEKIKINNTVMMRAFERVLLGLTDRKTTEKLNEARNLIAIHELGHFFMHFNYALNKNMNYNDLSSKKIKESISVLKISTESLSKGNILGYVLSKEEDGVLFTKKELENKIKVLYGGVANEEIFFGKDNITTGSYNDINEITKIVNHIYIELGMYGGSKINRFFIGNRNSENAANVNEETLAKINELANLLYEETKAQLLIYKDMVSIIVPILLEKYVLSIDDILEIIFEHKDVLNKILSDRKNIVYS